MLSYSLLLCVLLSTSLSYSAAQTDNDFALEFVSSTVNERIPETIKFGVVIANVTAVDRDNEFPNNDIRFRLFASLPASEYFGLDSLTGNIYVKKDLTLDTDRMYEMYIQAFDMGSPSKTSNINATVRIDVYRNLRSPVFTGEPYAANIQENTTTGTTILYIQYRDDDSDPPFNTVFISTIGDDKALTYFRLESNRRIVVSSDLTTDSDTQYRMRIWARDGGSPPRTATAIVTITVQRNLNSPVFEAQSYNVTILETLNLLIPFIQVKATDIDIRPLNNQVRYFIVGSNTTVTSFFMVDENTGAVMLRRSMLDYPNSTTRFTVNFDVIARDPSGKTGSAFVTVNVIRDQPPVFQSTPYRKNVIENEPIGTRVFTVTAIDPDIKGQIRYGVMGYLNAPFFFGVNNSTGVVSITNDLKTDIQRQYELIVTAYDSGSPGKTATATLTLTVEKNPSVPQFATPGPFRTTIWEDRAPGAYILNISASDQDGDTLRYDLLSDGTAESIRALMYFTIDPNNGLIYVAKSLMDDPANATLYKMKVMVRDQQYYEKQTEAGVEIAVNRNSQTPRFLGIYSITISENTPISTSLLQVSAQDNDMRPTSSLRYEATGFGSAPYFFYLSPTNGSIYLQNDLRSEKNKPSYVLQVQAYDLEYPLDRVSTNVIIFVTRNEFAPRFDQNQYFANISENTARNEVVLRLNATDHDAVDKITYRYDSATSLPFSQFFALSMNTGIITVSGDLTLDSRPSYQTTVFANDNSNPEKSTPVIVTVFVYRDLSTPVFSLGNRTASVSENAPIGTSVSNLVATDNDKVGVITYEATGIYPAPSLFAIHPTTGEVTVAKDLQFDAVRSDSEYKLTVVAYDSFRPLVKASATVTILVIRNPSTPQWTLPSYNTTIREDHTPFSSVIQVQANDQDSEDKISYDIVNEVDERALSSGPSEKFYIGTETGLILLKQSLMNTPFTRFTLTVQACDDGVPKKCANATVIIAISEDKNAPVFVGTPYIRTINENHPLGSMVLMVSASDQNPLAAIRFMIEAPVPRYFAMNEATGNITLAKELNTSLEITFQFKVSTYDSGEPQYKSTADVTIIVVRNLNAPRFLENPISRTVDENADYGFMVANTTAVDDDMDILRYTLTGNLPSEVQTYFTVDPDNGDIYLRNLLINPPRTSYQLFVLARDQRPVNEKTATATVNVFIDLDDPPRFLDNLPYTTTIQESHAVNSTVAQLNAADQDLKGNLTYEAVGNYPAEDYFHVDQSSGRVSLIRDLKMDPSGLQTYTLQVLVYDSLFPRLKATENVVISVVRNPFAPAFIPNTNYDAVVQENVTLGYQVLDVNARDSDNDPLTYEIVNSSPSVGENFFYLDPNTGVLTTKRLLTDTPDNLYQLTIQASDGRGKAANATATIRITRIPSDQRPQFISTPNTTITLRQTVNSSVFTVLAQDPDLVGNLRYELVGIYPAQNFFTVDPISGSVSVIRDLTTDNFETMQYTLRLEAYDTNNPALRAVGLSFITVKRNPAIPIFTSADYQYTAEEVLPVGSILIIVKATDSDQDEILFDVVPDQNGRTASEFFMVNRGNGQIYLIKDLRLTTQNIFPFQVRARDQGRPENFATANIVFSVTRDNGPPTFVQRDYVFEVPETEPVNNIIPFASIQAQDNFIRGKIQYEVVGIYPAPSFFDVDKNTGAIRIIRDLKKDQVATGTYVLNVTAFDSFYPANKAKTSINITVQRQPTFINTFYVYNITYGAAANTVVGQPNAYVDEDNILYTIENVSPSSGGDIFDIDSETGVISTTRKLADISSFIYQFNIGLQYKTIHTRREKMIVFIVVEDFPCMCVNNSCDLNNHMPTFKAPAYYVNVLEDNYSTKNKPLIEVSAEDPDFGPYGDLAFDVQTVPHDGGEKFEIKHNNGETKVTIICKGNIRSGDNYIIIVRASDKGGLVSRRRTSFVPVEVKVVPRNP